MTLSDTQRQILAAATQHEYRLAAAPHGLPAAARRAEGGGVTKTLLAPRIVEAILDGRQSEGAGLPQLLESFPADWAAQRNAFDAGWTSAS